MVMENGKSFHTTRLATLLVVLVRANKNLKIEIIIIILRQR